jgi:hypothetical protein
MEVKVAPIECDLEQLVQRGDVRPITGLSGAAFEQLFSYSLG